MDYYKPEDWVRPEDAEPEVGAYIAFWRHPRLFGGKMVLAMLSYGPYELVTDTGNGYDYHDRFGWHVDPHHDDEWLLDIDREVVRYFPLNLAPSMDALNNLRTAFGEEPW